MKSYKDLAVDWIVENEFSAREGEGDYSLYCCAECGEPSYTPWFYEGKDKKRGERGKHRPDCRIGMIVDGYRKEHK